MIIVLDDAEAVGYLRYLAARETGRPRFEAGGAHLDNEVRERPLHAGQIETTLAPQTPDRCRHYDDKGALTLDGDGPSPREDRPPCTFGGECPYLDNPDIGCPVKEALSSMRRATPPLLGADEVPRSDYVLAPQDPQRPAPGEESVNEPLLSVPEPQARKGVPRAKEWGRDEDAAMMAATSPTDAVQMYRAAYPDSDRSDAAIKTRFHSTIKKSRSAAAGDTESKGACSGAPEPEAAPDPQISKPHAWIGMQVRILDPESGLQGRTGLVRDYNYTCRKLLVDLDGSGKLWTAPESLLLIGAGRVS